MKRIDPYRLVLIGLLAVGLMFLGCSDDDDTVAPTPIDEFGELADLGDVYYTDYKTPNSAEGVNVTAMGVWETTMGDPSGVYHVIDWRSAASYDAGHIAGAENRALSNLVEEIDQIIVAAGGKTILNVCYSGQTASTATAIMNLFGQEKEIDAVNLKFGMFSWTTDPDIVGTDGYLPANPDEFMDWMDDAVEARPAAGSFPDPDTGKKTAMEILEARADMYVKGQLNTISPGKWNIMKVRDAGGMFERLGSTEPDDWFVVNYFPTAPYEAGHIPGAVRYQPSNDLKSAEFLDTLPTDKKILVYCWTGQTSAQVTAYLNVLGYEAYSLSKGVNTMCWSDTDILTTHQFAAPTTDLPVEP